MAFAILLEDRVNNFLSLGPRLVAYLAKLAAFSFKYGRAVEYSNLKTWSIKFGIGSGDLILLDGVVLVPTSSSTS